MDNQIDRVLSRLRLRSTIMLVVATVMLWRVSEWGMSFAMTCAKSGVDVAAITAAVQLPATFFAGWIFKLYQEGKKQ